MGSLADADADSHIQNVEPTFCEKFLNVAVTQREAQIEPDRVLDDRRREPVAPIGEWSHARTLSRQQFPRDLVCRDNAARRPPVSSSSLVAGIAAGSFETNDAPRGRSYPDF